MTKDQIGGALGILAFFLFSGALIWGVINSIEDLGKQHQQKREIELSQKPVPLADGGAYIELWDASIKDWLSHNPDWILVDIPEKDSYDKFRVRRKNDGE